jgi:Domain of unknown function (DUF4265)
MTVSLQFPLDVEDDWPPFGSESLPFETVLEGHKSLVPPLFVKDLSVDDIIAVLERDDEGMVRAWEHVNRSNHSTIWLMRIGETENIGPCLEKLRSMGCNTSTMDQVGCYSIDVPPSIAIADVDEILEQLEEDAVAVAFPSMRHPD